jgi:cyclopropane fatty-acyl-phospholipid synthase-like methyltransferase
MIISHKNKFIFLKTNKTAGTSIEIALSEFCGPDDIITPISMEDEAIRRQLGYRGCQNFSCLPWEYKIKDIACFLRTGHRKSKYYNHIPAVEIREHIGHKVWDSYFKFCFERNPWDRVVSLYYWEYRTGQRPDFSDFIRSNIPLVLKKKGYDLYTIDDKIAVNRIYRFEALPKEYGEIKMQLGLAGKKDLPNAKAHFRKEKKDYWEYYNTEEREIIADLFSDEIKLFNYEF